MAEPNALAADLDRIVARAQTALRGWMWRRALEKGVAVLFPATMLVPLLVLCAGLIELLTSRRLWPFDSMHSVALAVALPLVAVAVACVVAYRRQRVCRATALNLYDRHLGCKDRLVAADELLRVGPRSAFERAAIDDACAYARRASAVAPPVLAWQPPTLRPRRWPLGIVAALALTAGLFLEAKTLPVILAVGEAGGARPATASFAEAHLEAPPKHMEANQTAPRPAVQSQLAGSAASSAFDPSSQAGATASGASGQGGEGTQRTDAASKARRQRQLAENMAAPQRDGASSRIAGGGGSSSGSRVASSDQPFSTSNVGGEESLGAGADAVEDEEDEAQEASSSRSPALVSRKSPVDRSLTLSANNDQQPEELNGRGGPSGTKKTRGVAAMLLGVPLSDHLAGEPNPGRVKVRKERAAPEEKAVALVDAAPRRSRDEAFGSLDHIRLPPWARQAVRDFFLAQRNKPHGVPEQL